MHIKFSFLISKISQAINYTGRQKFLNLTMNSTRVLYADHVISRFFTTFYCINNSFTTILHTTVNRGSTGSKLGFRSLGLKISFIIQRNKEVVLSLMHHPLCFSLWFNNSTTLGKIKTFQ